MEQILRNDTIRIDTNETISLKHIFECGQCFRWKPSPKGGYVGVAFGQATRLWQQEDGLYLLATPQQVKEIWHPYLDLDRDYTALTQAFCTGEFMEKAVAYGRGLRILQQEPWEALVSFLVSQCNNIPRICSILDTFCKLFGQPLELEGDVLYAFPTPQRVAMLSLEDLAPLRAGYRAKYILSAAQAVAREQLDFEGLRGMNTPEARQGIMELQGVGRKVADCFLLFGLGKMDAFPVDTWMKKAGAHYAPDLASFGPYAGLAQQYIFYYARGTKLKMD